jgi:type IV secretion system protein VirB1
MLLGVILSVSLSTLVHLCAPQIAPTTATAIISVESGGYPWAIDDDTARKSYHPKTYEEARDLALSLLSQGHNLDLGIMQVNSDNLARYGVDPATAFDPCLNVSMGADILTRAYHASEAVYGPGQNALFHAFEIYNSGRANGAQHYAEVVWSAGLGL